MSDELIERLKADKAAQPSNPHSCENLSDPFPCAIDCPCALRDELIRRADLLPVVKPLVWEALHGGGFRAVCPVLGPVHVVDDSSGRWFCFSGGFKMCGFEGFSIEGLDSATNAQTTFSEWREARIRASLDMIDPAALVAGVYEAAIRACINMDLLTEHPNDAGSVVLRALTPANAQDALDAAIAKAVNAKLDAVAEYFTQIEKAYYEEATRPMPEHIRRMAAKMNGIARDAQNAILAMKEPE